MKGDRLGEFEELTLLAVCAVDPPVYGVPVQQFIERTTGRAVAMGAVYAALDRLETKGFVRSTFGPPTAQRGGKAKRLYEATANGRHALKELRTTRERIWKLIDARH